MVRVTRWSIVGILTSLSFLPLANWIPGGEETEPFGPLLVMWLVGTLGIGIVALLATWALPAPRAARLEEGRVDVGPPWGASPWSLAILCLAGLVAFGITSLVVFGGHPLHVDAITQAIQARTFLTGRLWLPGTGENPFTSTLLWIDAGGKSVSQFPPGWSLLLAAGEVLGMPWMVAPLCGALTLAATYALGRGLGETPTTSLAAGGVLALSPWFLFNAASWMNHVAAVMLLTGGAAALIWSMRDEAERSGIPGRVGPMGLAALAGVGFGLASWIRPLDALAFALPALAWLALRNRRNLLGFSTVLGITGSVLLLYNLSVHGGPLTFGYEVRWGELHGLGFHASPWGPPHTPVRGLELINDYLIRLQTVAFEAPVPALLPAVLTLAVLGWPSAGDRYLAVAGGLLLLGYFAYWHEGEHLGPRFLLPLLPYLTLLIVRLPRSAERLVDHPKARSFGTAFVLGMILAGLVFGTPRRATEYADMFPLRRLNPDGILHSAGFEEGVVLVPEPWGAQVLARMRGLGIHPSDADWLYGRVDLCRLDVAVGRLEEDRSLTPTAAWRLLRPLSADSSALVPSPLSDDPTQKALRGARYPQYCVNKALAERDGTLPLLPMLRARTRNGLTVARDLHEGNVELISEAGRRGNAPPAVVTIRPSRSGGFHVRELDLDSARFTWRVMEEEEERLQRIQSRTGLPLAGEGPDPMRPSSTGTH